MKAPPGQRYRDDFPRFGLDAFAERIVDDPGPWALRVYGDVEAELKLDPTALEGIPRATQTSDFHCVTTWSTAGLRWEGWRFADVYKHLIAPACTPKDAATYVVARAADGYRSLHLIEDLLQPDVLLADTLNGDPLGIAHGAPLRLVAPQQYGFKNPKHLTRLEFASDPSVHRPVTPVRFMDHLRGRVALEERGRLPGWLLRRIYRPLVKSTVRRFAAAMPGD